jgi:hypothetical protein
MITPSFGLTATERVLPRLALDFTTASLDSRVTFTRAGATATCVNSSGFITSVAADIPRFDYDPITLACKGLLIEESRVNSCLYSEDYTQAAWSKTGSTVTADAAVAPTNTTVADKLVENTSTGTHTVQQLFNYTSGVAYTWSFYAKQAGRSVIRMFENVLQGIVFAEFNLATGVATPIGSTSGWTRNAIAMQDAGNGWWRCIVTATPGANITNNAFITRVQLYDGTSTSYTGDGVSGVFLFGGQMETGAFATSYIPTEASQVTRTADVATMTGTDFSDWFNASEGTFAVTATVPAITGLNMRFISANDGTSSNRIDLFGITNTQLRVVNSGSVQALVTSGSIASYQERTSVGAYKANSFATATNADAISVATSGTVPTVDQLYIGRATISSATYCNGTIKRINYWQQRLTDNEVVAFSKGL